MRIPPNPHPITRIRNTLLTAASLTAFWLLLSLTSCAISPARPAVSMFAPTGPIPLAAPIVRMRASASTRA